MFERLVVESGNKKIVRKKTFKELFKEKDIVRICGAHDALSATLIEEAGFSNKTNTFNIKCPFFSCNFTAVYISLNIKQ